MKLWPLAAAALISAETAAIACSCMNTDDPAQLREFAADVVRGAVAMVEVETVLSYEESKGAGDRMRVLRTLAGDAAGEFTVHRRTFPSGASCDLLFERGQRGIVLLYPVSEPAGGRPAYRISGLCTAHLLDKPLFRTEVKKLMAAARGRAERG